MLKSFLHENLREAGCDEAGRGCLAGPVFAAAVVLQKGNEIPGLRDSKKLSPLKRESFRKLIEETCLDFAIAQCSVEEIDKFNILQASVRAMHKAVGDLKYKPEHLLVDGNYFRPVMEIPYTTIVGGDDKYLCIAASSILAKTYRDDYMLQLDKAFPGYGFSSHKGYATPKHIEAIKKLGYSPMHRKSFILKKLQLNLF